MTGTDCGGPAAQAATLAHFRDASVDNSAWDGPAAMSGCSSSGTPASCFGSICAGKKSGDTSTQGAWALPHHKTPGAAPNATGVANSLSRLPQTEGLTNATAAKAHLQAHMKAINPDYQAAAGFGQQRGTAIRQGAAPAIPNGRPRSHPFTGQMRSKVITKGGHDYLHVEGYASVFDLEYDMYDMFGIYWESVDPGAFTKSLANPALDVAFLLNHRGMTMARTTGASPTLRIAADDTGLGVDADLRMDRYDVQDLASAIDAELIDEMSFAFMLLGGEWDEEYMHFQITEADIHRGDVSAVNYGANPYTSIASRAAEILRDLDALPAGAARAAMDRLNHRPDMAGGVLLTAQRTAPARLGRAAARALPDTDESTGSLAGAVDAAIDQAMALVSGLDLTGLPPEVAQAIQLLGAADAACDELLENLGVFDPDEGAGELARPAGQARAIGMPTHVPGLGEPQQLGDGHGSFTGTHSHPHPAFGSQGGDDTHDHSHTHAGEGSHSHTHGNAAPGPMTVSLLMTMHEADNATDADTDAELLGN